MNLTARIVKKETHDTVQFIGPANPAVGDIIFDENHRRIGDVKSALLRDNSGVPRQAIWIDWNYPKAKQP